MLSPEYLESCSNPLLKLYEDLEDQIIADIARRIAKTGALTDTADWQLKVIREIGAVQQDIITRVSQMSGKTEDEIRRLFQESAYTNIETNAAPLIRKGIAVELELTAPMRQLLEAELRRTAGDVNNLTLTTGVTGGNLYYEMCNQAYMQAASGAFSPQEAIWNAVKGAAEDGATVQYTRRRDKLDVAIRRNVLTSLNQTAGKITEMNADQLGAEYYETSAHPGARPSHAAWQGRVFKIVGATREYPNFAESTGYGTAGGLCGINCRHSFYPFFPGISERAYSSDKLDWYRTHTVRYNDQDYTDYEASQIQREMERSIRESKRRAIAAKAAEDGATDEETKKLLKEKFSEESSILKQKEKRLKDFLRQTGRDAENSRVRVPGFGRSISQKAVWANRRSTSSNSSAQRGASRAGNERSHGNKGLAASGTNGAVEPHDPPEFIRKVLDTENRRKILSEYEEKIVDSPIENAIVITKDGKLYHCKGTLNGVYPDVDLGEELRGADMTHNHPPGSTNEWSFSESDRNLYFRWDLNVLRGVDERFEYEFSRNKEDIDELLSIVDFDEYSARHQKVIDEARKYGIGYRRKKRGQKR